MEVRTCKKCSKQKILTEFYKRKHLFRHICKECVCNYERIRYNKNPIKYTDNKKMYNKNRKELVKFRDIKRLYGINREQYEEMLLEQNNKCKICIEDMSKICVDHCHETGIVRGLLCNKCNVTLGLIKEDLSILNRVGLYLTSFKYNIKINSALSGKFKNGENK